MASSKYSEFNEVLKISIEEQRRVFDHITNIYDQLRIKALSFLAGEVAIVTFLFSGNGVPLPSENYGKIFFSFGVFCLVAAFAFLLWTISALNWRIPFDGHRSEKLQKEYGTPNIILKYINDDYVESIGHCLKLVGTRAKRFNWTIYLLSAGVIILAVIKNGG